MTRKTTLGLVLVLSIAFSAIGVVFSQSTAMVSVQAKANLALEEAKERVEIYRVYEEENRLLLSIMECKIKIDRINRAQAALNQKQDVVTTPAKPPMADPVEIKKEEKEKL